MIDCFPEGFVPRQVQRDAIRDIEQAVRSEYPHVILCAPTGVGKSHIAATVALHAGDSFVLTAQIALQEQYARDFPWMAPAKGKANYPCLMRYDPQVTSEEEAASDASLSCSHGVCSWPTPRGMQYCQYKPAVDEFRIRRDAPDHHHGRVEDPPGMCHYYNAKYHALLAPHSVYNYAAYLSMRQQGISDRLVDRGCIIADEAHELEDQIIDFLGIDITAQMLRDAGAAGDALRHSPPRDAESVIGAARGLCDAYDDALDGQNSAHLTPAGGARIARIRAFRDRLDAFIREISRLPDNFVIQARRDGPVAVSARPLSLAGHVSRYFDADTCLYVSATIHQERFCAEMGIDARDCAFVEVRRSPFPPAARRVQFLDVARLSRRSPPGDLALVHERVGGLLRRHRAEKGLILTSSRAQCEEIMRAAGPDGRARMLPVYHGAGTGREEAIRRHMDSDAPTVLLSPSLWVGIDLADCLSRFCIIVKAPYAAMSDLRTRIKAERDPVWYQYRALSQMIQGMGRSVRNDSDWAATYVLDSNGRALAERMRRYIPRACTDVLGGGP